MSVASPGTKRTSLALSPVSWSWSWESFVTNFTYLIGIASVLQVQFACAPHISWIKSGLAAPTHQFNPTMAWYLLRITGTASPSSSVISARTYTNSPPPIVLVQPVSQSLVFAGRSRSIVIPRQMFGQAPGRGSHLPFSDPRSMGSVTVGSSQIEPGDGLRMTLRTFDNATCEAVAPLRGLKELTLIPYPFIAVEQIGSVQLRPKP